MWRDHVQAVYDSLEELESYDELYSIAKRCGYRSAAKLWSDNPVIQGSTNPDDFGLYIAPQLDGVLCEVENRRAQYEEAQNAAEEALTVYFENLFAELVKRYPRRRFYASSGMGSLSVDVYPGPIPSYSHHPRQPYSWIWNISGGNDRFWGFLWMPWEKLLNEFAMRSGLEYVNFTRDVDVRGPLYREED